MKYDVWILALIAISLASCSTNRQLRKCDKCFNQYTDTSYVIKDSVAVTFDTIVHVTEVPADTTIQIIQIECDSTGKANIVNSTKEKGNRSDISTDLQNNTLTIQATCKAFIDSVDILNKTIHKLRSETNTVFVPKLVEAKLTWWQRFKINYGGYAFLLIALYGGYTGISIWAKSNNPLVWLNRLKR